MISRTRPVPGDGLLHPVAIGALVFLVLNDHWLKSAWPGPLTGKLSDVAGLILAPLALQALIEVVDSRRSAAWRPSRGVLIAAAGAVGIGFAAINVLPAAADVYRIALGVAQWPFRALEAVLRSAPIPGVQSVAFVVDPSDLLALPGMLVAIASGWGRGDRGG